jgi:hypothetical protein
MLVNRCNGSINKILRRTTTRIPQLYLSEKHSCVLVVPLVLARRVDRQRWQRQPIAKNCPDGTSMTVMTNPPREKINQPRYLWQGMPPRPAPIGVPDRSDDIGPVTEASMPDLAIVPAVFLHGSIRWTC